MKNIWKKTFADPIRGLSLDRLTSQIDSFTNGHFAEFALASEAMEQRDDILKNVISKRKKAVTRHGWEILAENCSSAARYQRLVLDYFYRNLRCCHAIRKNESGGFKLLISQMMDCVAKGYAVHEILWKPQVRRLPSPAANHDRFHREEVTLRSNDALTAEFRFVPLWYFEAVSGEIRFLPHPFSAPGEVLRESEWLVTPGEGLMVACARAFLFKHYPLQSWLDYAQKYGTPAIRAVTSATRGTPEFDAMEETLANFMAELSVVTNTSESIDVVDLKGTGESPFPTLVERMDRVMAALWRGADLSTISRDQGYGATLQEEEARLLEQDDARFISEHLNSTVDRWVLDMMFGAGTPALARVKILVTPEKRTSQDLAIDQFLLSSGARLPLADTLERYGRVLAKRGEPALALRNASPASISNQALERASIVPDVSRPRSGTTDSFSTQHLFNHKKSHQ